MATKADLPPFDSLLKPAIECFKARGGSMTIEEMEDAMAAAMELSEELLAVPHGTVGQDPNSTTSLLGFVLTSRRREPSKTASAEYGA
jgi:hypothetical protein